MSEPVLFSQTQNVGTITLNRPARLNVLTLSMARELLPVVQRSVDDQSIRCVVITGAGRAFCAGADLREFQAHQSDSGKFLEQLASAMDEIILAIRALPKPAVAAINGATAGGGLSLALACDLRIAAENATFSEAFARIGLVPDNGATFFLPRLVGLTKATELFLTGAVIDAKEAERIGLVTRVMPQENFMERVNQWATQLANGPTAAYARMKALINQSFTHDLPSQLAAERAAQGQSAETQDFREGLNAFLEKRAARFVGA